MRPYCDPWQTAEETLRQSCRRARLVWLSKRALATVHVLAAAVGLIAWANACYVARWERDRLHNLGVCLDEVMQRVPETRR